MEKTNRKIILFALLMAAVTTVLVYFFINKDTQVTEDERKYVKVFTAVADIPVGKEIKSEDIKLSEIDEEYVLPGAVKDSKEAVGKIAGETIYKDEQLISGRLVEIEELKLSYDIPAGKRAVAMFVNKDTGLTDNLEPGDFVDVIATFTESRFETDEAVKIYPQISGILLQDVRVLAIDGERGQLKSKLENPQQSAGQRTVTLEIDAGQVEKFTYALEYGILRLALRGVDDHEPVDGMPAIRDDFFDSRTIILP